jgi:hypothetical protein
MDTKEALAVVAAAMADRGRLTDEREEECGTAIMALVGGFLTNQQRIAEALETLARNDTHRTDWYAKDAAQLRVGANCDTRQVG